jgi:hypothetical protein
MLHQCVPRARVCPPHRLWNRVRRAASVKRRRAQVMACVQPPSRSTANARMGTAVCCARTSQAVPDQRLAVVVAVLHCPFWWATLTTAVLPCRGQPRRLQSTRWVCAAQAAILTTAGCATARLLPRCLLQGSAARMALQMLMGSAAQAVMWIRWVYATDTMRQARSKCP